MEAAAPEGRAHDGFIMVANKEIQNPLRVWIVPGPFNTWVRTKEPKKIVHNHLIKRLLVFDLDGVELHRLDPFHRHKPFSEGFELAPVTVDEDDFKALLVCHVRVEGGLDDTVELVFDVGDVGEESPLLVIVDHRDDAFPQSLDIGHPLVIRDVRADRVADTFRARRVAAVVEDFIEPVEQVFRERYSYPGEIVIHVRETPVKNISQQFVFKVCDFFVSGYYFV